MTNKPSSEWKSEEIAARTYGKRPDQRFCEAKGTVRKIPVRTAA